MPTYDPNAKTESSGGGAKAPPGTYDFKVDDANNVTFKSGNEGIKLTLLVGAGNRDVKSFCNLVFAPAALWRVEQFMQSVGLDFNKGSVEAHELVGLRGRAEFVVNDRGYLEPDRWLPVGGEAPEPGRKFAGVGPPPMDDADVPF